jgi:hypothetical protein
MVCTFCSVSPAFGSSFYLRKTHRPRDLCGDVAFIQKLFAAADMVHPPQRNKGGAAGGGHSRRWVRHVGGGHSQYWDMSHSNESHTPEKTTLASHLELKQNARYETF